MVKFEIPDSLISNILKAGGALIILVMVATLIRPSVTGNVVNRLNLMTTDLSNCELMLNETTSLLESSEDAIFMLTSDISAINSALYSCSYNLNLSKTALTIKNEEHSTLEKRHSDLLEKHKILTEEYNRSSNDYMELAKFAAQKWCCVRKVDNPDIESFDIIVRDNQVVCREFNRGSHQLSC